jgi:hypothetical protein
MANTTYGIAMLKQTSQNTVFGSFLNIIFTANLPKAVIITGHKQ